MASRSPAAAQHLGAAWTDRIALVAVAGAVAAFLVCEVYSLDIWWQVAIGRDLLDGGGIPGVDRFSVAGEGRPYHDSHWLFQVVMAGAHRLLDWVGVQLMVVAAWAVTLALCYRSARRWVGVLPSAVLVFLAAMASLERFLPRPELATFLGIAAFYNMLQAERYRSWGGVATFAALAILWTNAHGLFVIGPFMVACYWAEALLRRRDRLRRLSWLLAVVLLATLANPYLLGAWRYAALLFVEAGAAAPEVFHALGELGPTFGAGFRSSPAFWFFAVLGLLAVLAMVGAIQGRRLSPRLAIVVALAVAALAGRRNVVLFCLVAAPFAAEGLRDLAPGRRPWPRPAALVLAGLVAAWAWYPLSGAYYVRMEIPARAGWGVTPSFFPHELPSFLDRIGFEGRVLNSNTLGGFYLFHGYPGRRPLTDGRWEVYRPEELNWILGASRRPGEWRQVVARYRVDGVLLAHTSPEARAQLPELVGDPGWRLVYYDRAASFWLPAATAAQLTETVVQLDNPPAPDRVDDGLILDAFLAGIGAGEARLVNLERTLRFGRRTERLLESMGAVQIRLGRYEEAERTLENLLRRAPERAAALNELAFLAYRRGDLRRAADLMRRAVAVAPDDDELRENLRRVEEALARGPAGAPEGGS